jgi:hypothetical protein
VSIDNTNSIPEGVQENVNTECIEQDSLRIDIITVIDTVIIDNSKLTQQDSANITMEVMCKLYGYMCGGVR